MSEGTRALTAIVAGAFGLAIIAVILSNQANTANVLTAGGSALAGVITAATGPVTGGGTSLAGLSNPAGILDGLLPGGAGGIFGAFL